MSIDITNMAKEEVITACNSEISRLGLTIDILAVVLVILVGLIGVGIFISRRRTYKEAV